MLIKPRSKLGKKTRRLLGLPQVPADTRIAVWKAHRLLYVRNPKCANTSIIGSIADAELGRAPRADIIHLEAGWTSFSFVRNPWARLVSTYQDKARGDANSSRMEGLHIQGFLDAVIPIDTDMSFEAFCEVVCALPDSVTEKHLRSQSSVLLHKGKPIVAFIGKVESIQSDWADLMRRVGLDINLRHLNRSRHEHYSRYYRDSNLVNRVGDRYAEDIRNFNYDFVEA